MIHVQRSENEGLVKYVIFQIWDEVAPVGALPEDFDPDMENSLWLELWSGLDIVGVYKVHEHDDITVVGHANVLPEHRKKYTDEITKEVAGWMKDHLDTSYEKLIVTIPVDKPNVLKYAERVGLKEEAKIMSMSLNDFYNYGKE